MEIIFLVVIGIVSVVLFLETLSYEVSSYDTSGGPAQFPQYILIMIFIVIGILIVRNLLDKNRKPFAFTELFKTERGVFLGSLLVFIVLLDFLGFFLSSSIFLIFTVNYLTVRYKGTLGIRKAIFARSLTMVIFSLTINYLFTKVMRIMLPAGILDIF